MVLPLTVKLPFMVVPVVLTVRLLAPACNNTLPAEPLVLPIVVVAVPVVLMLAVPSWVKVPVLLTLPNVLKPVTPSVLLI